MVTVVLHKGSFGSSDQALARESSRRMESLSLTSPAICKKNQAQNGGQIWNLTFGSDCLQFGEQRL
jgi:hypothetical protein